MQGASLLNNNNNQNAEVLDQIADFIKNNRSSNNQNYSSYVPIVHENIQKIAQQMLDTARQVVAEAAKKSETCFEAKTTEIITSSPGIVLISEIVEKIYGLTIRCNKGRCNSTAQDQLCPTIFQHMSYRHLWHLTICWTPDNPYIYEPQTKPSYQYKPEARLQNLWNAAIQKKDTNVTFVIQGQTFLAHECVLKAQSEYFATMFNNQMRETQKKLVTIDDYSYDSYRVFLEFVYVGKLDEKREKDIQLMVELLDIGNQYRDVNLIDYCTDNLNAWLKDNALEDHFDMIFTLGCLYEVEPLLQPCLRLAESNKESLVKTLSLINPNNFELILNLVTKFNCKNIKEQLLPRAVELLKEKNPEPSSKKQKTN